jgi:hypothetical protein
LDRNDLAWDGNRCWAVVNTVVNLWVLENAGVAWLAVELLASQEAIWCMKVVSELVSVSHVICAFVYCMPCRSHFICLTDVYQVLEFEVGNQVVD